MVLLSVLLALVALALWLPSLVDLAAIAGTLVGRSRSGLTNLPDGPEPRLLVLVPAHNEELLIANCVRSLVGMDYPAASRRIVVIADNSTDATARLAREAGAECLERHDVSCRGKPHALAWALNEIGLADIDACVVVDADTAVDPGFARGLAALAPLDGIAVQANIGTMNEWDNWLTRLAGVLARCRYEVTYRLRDAAGINCPLTGNGMCIGRRLLEPNGWQAFSLTENWELYASYTSEGVAVRYAYDARLFTQQVRSMRQGQIQRSRWLAGRMWVLRTWGGRILWSRRTPIIDKFATLAELASLSPVLQLSVAITVAITALALHGPFAQWIAVAATASIATQIAATVVVMFRHPYPLPTLSAFFYLPIYAVWRTSVAAGTLLFPGTGEWRKTERHSL
jgi:cellulose synthase/poly-beta-1,6-N-acetylglucosamine synthase-like glycosyltransferase